MKWTHKVVYKLTGEWWFAKLVDNTFLHNGIHEKYERASQTVNSVVTDKSSVEDFYTNKTTHIVTKLNVFKGNKL